MSTTLHTFMDIFASNFDIDGENIQLKKIKIPIIQRDYAQGRLGADIKRIRTRFLNSLHQAILGEDIRLDFVYGDIDKNGIMTPLDGQQRLTTLFLLHYYVAKKENVAQEEYDFLKNFTYETRYSARDFCWLLVDKFNPSFNCKISEEIVDQAWFPLDWLKDPTISSMLVMLDDISDTFREVDNIWNRLKEGAIYFYFLPIKEMGLTDELYIKMNSRGKPLTQFEHFKAELEHELREIDENVSKRIMNKIDISWTDMLWYYKGDDNVIDDEFLRYFHFICDIICYKNGGTTQGKSTDEFDLLKEYFSKESNNVETNIQTLESYFDCWCDLDGISPTDLIKSFISHNHEAGKIRIESRYELDIFKDCMRNYDVVSGNGNRVFPLNRIVMLFAIVTYLQNRKNIDKKDFVRRLRIVNNLIQNSEDEISDSEIRTSGNRMPAILKQVEGIILTGNIDLNIEKAFNKDQLNEEQEKIEWLNKNSSYAEVLFELEDHDLLQGQVGIVGLDRPECFSRFLKLFECDRDLIDCALMSVGNYSQHERKSKWRYQLGSSGINTKPWRNLFHHSANNLDYDRTKDVLRKILDNYNIINNETLHDISSNYVQNCEDNSLYDIRYYYIKYKIFRPGSYGKYCWEDFDTNPYCLYVMRTESKISEKSYQPFLKEVDDKNTSPEYYGERILIGDKYIKCEKDAYVVRNLENDVEIDRLGIAQNQDGIDVENRIEKFRKWYVDNYVNNL